MATKQTYNPTWEPMSIATADEVFPIAIIDPQNQGSGYFVSGNNNEYRVVTETNIGSTPLLDENYRDGNAIVQRDHISVLQSNNTGSIKSASLENKILHSNFDSVDDLTIKQAHVLSPSAPESQCAVIVEPLPPAGYRCAEYTSMYDTGPSTEYQFSEYKSIYDK
jgi:hypothetical protein